MTAYLTQAQIEELDAIANSGQSGARVAYYSKLADFGITYGSLALGVVLDDQMSGRVANEYFMSVAIREGISVSDQQWASIGDALMQADLAARMGRAETTPDGQTRYGDLVYTDIRNYHEVVFDTLGGTVPAGQGVSIEGWTAYAPIEVLGTSTWEQLLADDALEQFGVSAAVTAKMVYAVWDGGSQDSALAVRWIDALWEARSAPLADGSPLAFPVESENAYIFMGTRGADTLIADEIAANGRDIMLLGLNGNDTITAATSGGYVDAGAGDDTIIGQASAAKIDGGAGFDTLTLSSHATKPDVLVMIDDGHNNEFSGSVTYSSLFEATAQGEEFSRIESIVGTAGSDHFAINSLSSQGFPTVRLNAGEGADTIEFNETDRTVSVDLLKLVDTAIISEITGPGQVTLDLAGFENVTTGSGNDLVYGNDASNQFILLDGFNEAHGRGGDDSIYGGSQRDQLYGDDGDDILYGYAGDDLIHGGTGADSLSGMDGDDELFGGAGEDWLDGGDGNDWLDGGDGYDDLFGGAGNDTFVISQGEDFIYDFTLGEDRLVGTNGTYSEIEGGDILISATEGSAILWDIALADLQQYDSLGLLWA